MAVTKKEVKETLEGHDAVILHFARTTEDETVPKEYIYIIDDEEALEDDALEPVPGFELKGAIGVDGDLDTLPLETILHCKSW